ncbi:MAG: hypothetical protein ACI9O6_002421 [Glaciecola sp.]
MTLVNKVIQRRYWFKATISCTRDSLIHNLKQHGFIDGRESGFLFDSISDTIIAGRYIRRKLLKREFADPFGNTETDERIVYETIRFKLLGNEVDTLELLNPNNNIKVFLNELNECTEFNLSISKHKASLSTIIAALIDKGFEFKSFKELELADITFTPKISGKMILKGNIDFSNYFTDINLSIAKHKIKRLKADVEFKGFKDSIELHEGKYTTTEKFSVLIHRAYYESLLNIDKSSNK